MPNHEKPTFESIVAEYGPFIRRTLAQLGVASRDISDVEQEVLRGVNRGLPTFDPELSANPSNALRGWIFAICERQAANHRRARRRRSELFFTNDELDTEPAASPCSEDRLIAEQHRAILMYLLEKLEPQRRAVIVAYELEGIPMADVATAFSIPVNTAWNRLRLAREDLREAWERYERRRRTHGSMPLPPLAALITEVASQNAATGAGAATPGAAAASNAGAAASNAGAAASNAGVAASNAGAASQVGSALSGVVARGTLQVGAKAAAKVSLAKVLFAASAGIVVAALAGPSIHAAAGPAPEPSSAPEVAVEQRPAALPAPPLPSSAPPPASGAVQSQNTDVADSTVQAAGADDKEHAAAVVPASVTRSVPAPVKPKPARDVAAAYERRLIEGARVALAGGDFVTAQKKLAILESTFPDGPTAGERELLYGRYLVHEGRRNEAIDRAKKYLDAHPEAKERAAMEAYAGPLDSRPARAR